MKSRFLHLLIAIAVLALLGGLPALAQEDRDPAPTETGDPTADDDAGESGDANAEAEEAEGDEAGDDEAGDDEAEEEPAEDRVTFDFRLSGPEGGRVRGTAGDFEYQEGQYIVATDGVDLRYRDLRLRARRARVDVETRLLTAEGEVILDEGPERLTGDTLEYDLDARTGKVTQATAYVDPDYYFSGAQIAKVGERTFTVDDGIFTACEGDVPPWSIHLGHARVTVDEYARIRHARLKFKKLPVLYAPYVLWPATTERTSGFLVPKPGYSNRRGASLDLAYYKTLGRSADSTFYLDLSTEGYFGFGNEVRYHTSENTQGYFRGYYVAEPDDVDPDFFNPVFDTDRQPGDDRWKVEYFHETEELWGKFRGVINVQEYSDFDYLQDYERDVGRQTRSFIYSNAYLTRNSGQHSFNVMIDQRERILTGDRTDLRRQLPEIEFRLRPTQLGNTPIYFSLDSSLHYLSVEQNQLEDRYGRANIEPTLSIPVSNLTWLSAKVNLGGSATFYTDSLAADEDGTLETPRSFGGGGLERLVPDAGVEIVGPVFSRIFEKGLGRFSKFKHVIEPRATYRYVDEFDEQNQIFGFDEVDALTPTNGWVFSLTNRLLAKPSNPDEGGAVEIASFELRQALSLDDDRPGQGTLNGENTSEGPLFASLRVNPSRKISLKTDFRYNTLYNQLQSFSFSGEKRFGGTVVSPGMNRVGLTWFTNWNAVDGEKVSDQLRFFTRFPLFTPKLTLDAEVSYDVLSSEIRYQRYFLNWQAECYGWQLEFRESIRGPLATRMEDRDVRFSLTLKNVGTFLDLNESF